MPKVEKIEIETNQWLHHKRLRGLAQLLYSLLPCCSIVLVLEKHQGRNSMMLEMSKSWRNGGIVTSLDFRRVRAWRVRISNYWNAV